MVRFYKKYSLLHSVFVGSKWPNLPFWIIYNESWFGFVCHYFSYCLFYWFCLSL